MDNMRTRTLYHYTDELGNKHTNVVWFGVCRTFQFGFDYAKFDNAKFDAQKTNSIFLETTKSGKNAGNSFSEKQQSVADSLTQQLSILKGELWYQIKYGLPLPDKKKQKVDFDTFILSVVNRHSDVQSVKVFTSQLVNHHYSCNMQIQSIFGLIDISIG